MKNSIINKINNSLCDMEKTLNSMYRNKCYIVVNGERIYNVSKTKRGAEGYIKRHSCGYYDEYSMEMVYPSYEIIEVKQSEIVGFNNFTLWHGELIQYLGSPWMISNIEYYIKFVDNKELLKYIKESIEDIKNNKGVREPRQIRIEKGFNSYEEYREAIEAEEAAKWAAYEAEQEVERKKAEERRIEEERKQNILNNSDAKLIKTDKNIIIEGIKVARKAADLEEVEQWGGKENIIISNYIILNNECFNILTNDLYMNFNLIAKSGGTRVYKDGQEIDYDNTDEREIYNNKDKYNFYEDNILITNQDNTKFIVVNPHGYSYCRYTGILTAAEGKRVLRQLKGETKANKLQVIESKINELEDITNAGKCNNLYLEIEALEKRFKLVKSNKLKYKLQDQINSKIKEIAKIILSDELLYMQFINESKNKN